MQRLTMLPAATLLTTGCGSKQDDAARIEADRAVPAPAPPVATPPAPAGGHKPFLDEHDPGKVSDDRVDPDSGTILHRSDAPSADADAEVHQEAHGWVPDTIVRAIEGRRPVSHP